MGWKWVPPARWDSLKGDSDGTYAHDRGWESLTLTIECVCIYNARKFGLRNSRRPPVTTARFSGPLLASPMKLYDVDFQLLDALAAHGRNVAVNLAIHIDEKRGYVNQRLRVLYQADAVQRIGPKPRAGLYEIAETGREFLEHRHLHDPPMTLDGFQTAIANATDS
jgi:hypothetical protein